MVNFSDRISVSKVATSSQQIAHPLTAVWGESTIESCRLPSRQRLRGRSNRQVPMGRAARVCAAILPLLVARRPRATAGCGSDLTTLGPTPVDQGIVIYIHADFRGSSQGIVSDVHDLTKTEGPCSTGGEGEKPTWRECVSSVRVFPGWSAILYRDEDFKGRSVTITSDMPDLNTLPGPCDDTFNDCVRSIRVTRQ